MTLREAPDLTITLPEITTVSPAYAIASLGSAAQTLFVTLKHDNLHKELEDACMDGPHQPPHAPVEETTRQITKEILPAYDLRRPAPMRRSQLVHLGGTLIQFGDCVPRMHTTVRAQYGPIAELREEMAARAAHSAPLGYPEQLDLALEQNSGNISESLWRLFLASRLHARWLDSAIIANMPYLTRDQKLEHMRTWRNSIAACKEPSPSRAQDPSGDAYYTWTHALAKVAFTIGPARETCFTRTAVGIFENGTRIMHKVVHNLIRQVVVSDHTVAAAYGNAIGQGIIDSVRPNE